jgi:hypothetical protein
MFPFSLQELDFLILAEVLGLSNTSCEELAPSRVWLSLLSTESFLYEDKIFGI